MGAEFAICLIIAVIALVFGLEFNDLKQEVKSLTKKLHDIETVQLQATQAAADIDAVFRNGHQQMNDIRAPRKYPGF